MNLSKLLKVSGIHKSTPMKKHLSFVIVLTSLGFVSADEPSKPPAKDPQAAHEPKSAPGAGQVFLAKFVGDWDVAKAFFPRTGEPSRSKGTCRQSMTHKEHFLQSDFVFGEGETASTGQGLIGFEPETGLFTSVWIDSRQTRMSLRRSLEKFDGRKIVLYSKSLEADGKESRRSRTETTIGEDARTITHRQYAIGNDGAERLMMELVMTRKAAR